MDQRRSEVILPRLRWLPWVLVTGGLAASLSAVLLGALHEPSLFHARAEYTPFGWACRGLGGVLGLAGFLCCLRGNPVTRPRSTAWPLLMAALAAVLIEWAVVAVGIGLLILVVTSFVSTA